jgi:hypothetical protein
MMIMKREFLATSCLAGLVIASAAIVYAAPNPSESGPSMSGTMTPTTSTTSPTNVPRYPGSPGYGGY